MKDLAALGLWCCSWAFSSCSVWASHCNGFSCCRAQALGHAGSVVVVHGLSCPVACGIFLDQWLNLCLLHWQWILNHWTTREVPNCFLIHSDMTKYIDTYIIFEWIKNYWKFRWRESSTYASIYIRFLLNKKYL